MSVERPTRLRTGWRVRVRWFDADGRRHAAMVRGATPAEATKLGQMRLAEERRRVELVKAGVELPDYGPGLTAFVIEHAWELWPRTGSAKHRDDQLGRLARHVEPMLGDKPVGQISALDVRRLRTAAIERVSPATWNRILSALSKVMTLAIEAGHRKSNPCDRMSLAETGERTEQLEGHEIGAVLSAAPSDKWRAFFAVLILTGARPSSVRGLRVADVDLERRRMTFTRWKRRGQPVRMPMHPRLVEYMRPVMADRDGREFVFTKRGARDRTADSAEMSPAGYRKTWQAMLRGAGITRPVLVADLRATFATQLVEAGASLTAVRDVLHHKSANTTNRYLRRAQERAGLDPAAETIGRLNLGDGD